MYLWTNLYFIQASLFTQDIKSSRIIRVKHLHREDVSENLSSRCIHARHPRDRSHAISSYYGQNKRGWHGLSVTRKKKNRMAHGMFTLLQFKRPSCGSRYDEINDPPLPTLCLLFLFFASLPRRNTLAVIKSFHGRNDP